MSGCGDDLREWAKSGESQCGGATHIPRTDNGYFHDVTNITNLSKPYDMPSKSVGDGKQDLASSQGEIVGKGVQAGEYGIGIAPGVKNVVHQKRVAELTLVPFDSCLAKRHILELIFSDLCSNIIRVEIHP